MRFVDSRIESLIEVPFVAEDNVPAISQISRRKDSVIVDVFGFAKGIFRAELSAQSKCSSMASRVPGSIGSVLSRKSGNFWNGEILIA